MIVIAGQRAKFDMILVRKVQKILFGQIWANYAKYWTKNAH